MLKSAFSASMLSEFCCFIIYNLKAAKKKHIFWQFFRKMHTSRREESGWQVNITRFNKSNMFKAIMKITIFLKNVFKNIILIIIQGWILIFIYFILSKSIIVCKSGRDLCQNYRHYLHLSLNFTEDSVKRNKMWHFVLWESNFQRNIYQTGSNNVKMQ